MVYVCVFIDDCQQEEWKREREDRTRNKPKIVRSVGVDLQIVSLYD